MRPKQSMPIAVLTPRTEPDTIGKRRLQAIEIRPDNIHTLIAYQTRQVLPNTLPHDASLAVIDAESFLLQYG